MDLLAVYPYGDTIIAPCIEASIAWGVTFQNTESIRDDVFMLTNGVDEIYSVFFGFVSFPRQGSAVWYANRIAFSGFYIRFAAHMKDKISVKVVRKEWSQHEPFPDIFSSSTTAQRKHSLHGLL